MRAARMWAWSEVRHGWAALLIVALLVAITGGAVTAGVAGARRARGLGRPVRRGFESPERHDLRSVTDRPGVPCPPVRRRTGRERDR